MEVYRRSSWLLLLLGFSLLATALQGVQGEVESVGPTESECRPYIEKALKELEQGEAEHAAPPETDSKEDLPTVEITTDDSDRPEGDGDDDAESEGKDSTDSAEIEKADEETTKEGEEDQSGDEEKPEEGAQSTEDEERIEPEAASQEDESKSGEDQQESEDVEAAAEGAQSEEAPQGTSSTEDTESHEEAQADQPETSQEGEEEQQAEAEGSHEDEQPSQEEEAAQGEVSAEEVSKETEEAASSHEEVEEEVEAAGASKEEEEHQGAAEEVDEPSKEASQEEEAQVSAEASTEEAQASAEEAQTSAEEVQASAEEAQASAEEAQASAEVEASVEEAQASTEEASEHQEEHEASAEEKASPEAEGSVEEPDVKSGEEEGAPASEASEASKEEAEASKEEAEAGGSQEAEVEANVEAEVSKEEAEASKEGSTEEVAEESAQASAEEKQSAEDDTQKSQEESKSEESEGVKEEAASKETVEKEGTSPEQESKEGQEEEVKESQEEGSKEGEASEEKSVEGVAEVEELIQEPLDITELRPRDHIEQLLKLDRESSEAEKITDRMSEIILRDLKKLYENAIKPLETLYKYRDLSNRHFGDAEIFSKPLILFMGPWSGGKSSIINYLVGIEFNETSLHTGAEPSPAYFNILMHGEEPEILDGTELAADYTFSGLQKFGQGLEERLRGYKLPSKLLEKVNIVEIPGILEVRKQVSRVFPFNDACQWFIDRADIIFLVYDPSKLDVGPETEAILDQLKGREPQTRIVLNKADQVKPEELMRVQGALIWNISPLMSSAQPPIMYTTSLWSRPYEIWAPVKLLQAQERAFLRDLRTAIDKRIDNKIASARRFAVRVRNHAKMVDCYLTTYYNHKSVFGNRKQISDEIINHPQDYHIYEGLSTLTNISRYDLPDPDVYRDFFKLNALYDFQQLSATCTYFRGCPINRLDVAIAYDLPELVGKHKRLVETAVHEANVATPGS